VLRGDKVVIFNLGFIVPSRSLLRSQCVKPVFLHSAWNDADDALRGLTTSESESEARKDV